MPQQATDTAQFSTMTHLEDCHYYLGGVQGIRGP